MDYRIYIDETGNFSKKTSAKKDSDFVAGWVSKNLTNASLEAVVLRSLRGINEKLPETLRGHAELNMPKDLHFVPLHLPQFRTGADAGIRFPAEFAPEAVRTLFSTVAPHTAMAFRSRGFPHFYANEQGAYTDILRATVLQVIDALNYLPEDRLEFFIAARRIKKLVGEFGYENPKTYEKQFCENLSNEITSVFKGRKLTKPISIAIRSAKEEIGLAVADFFCGAFRWTQENYLQFLPAGLKREFNIHNAFVYVSKRQISRIRFLFESDPAQALLQAFCHLARNPSDNEINTLTKSIREKCDKREIQAFASNLETHLHSILVENPFRYQCLDFVETLLDSIAPRIDNDRVQAVVHSFRIKLAGHKGTTELDHVRRYTEFLDSKGPGVFGGRYRAAQERVETVLSAVQPAAFNRFRFEEVEGYLLEEYRRYLATHPETHAGTDETLARLEGTLGQMFGFLCDYPGQEGYFEDALRHLKNDVSRCEINSPYWKQGMGYLTTLFFKRGDFDRAAEYFCLETGRGKVLPARILDLSQTAAFDCERDDFFQLHRLYLCALALKKGMSVGGEDRHKEKLMGTQSPDAYPRFQSLKWLGVIFALKGDQRAALELFAAGIGGREQGLTIDAIKLPLKILLHWARLSTGEKSGFNLSQELEKLEKKEPGISENLTRLGIDKYHRWEGSWDPYRIAALMPFYYA